MLYKIGFYTISLSLLVSCGNNPTSEKKQEPDIKKDTVVVADKCTTLFNEAKRMDDILLRATVVNNDVAEQAINSFYKYAYNCKTDTLAPVFLIKAGQVAQSVKKYTQAQAFFRKCIDDFPKFKSRGAAMFLLAQLYDDKAILNDESEAAKLYHQIIREYPSSSYANDAKACIQNLGKTDEQLIQEFLKKNK
ncbi:MAG: tetratricopeptide repeat protein [Bacteroidetes bacterium]|nr:tetratricopeptide repeat protein [Bacteroidota bacterium]